MADQGAHSGENNTPVVRPRNPYRGRPENQRNLKAVNAWKGPVQKQNNKPPMLTPRNAPRALPKPTRLHDNSHVKPSGVSPAEGSVFTSGISLREISDRQTFQPSTPALIDIASQCYSELVTDYSNFSKAALPEYLDYYATALLWLRIMDLKHKNSDPLTSEEVAVWSRTQSTTFSIPEPITLQLKQLGNTVAKHIDHHLYPYFPQLSTRVVAGHGGYYGKLVEPAPDTDNSVHNLYEELPCLGVMSEAVRAAISNAPTGPYQSAVTYRGLQPNRNLLGFRPLGSRRNEPKNLAFSCNITEIDFESYPVNTAFNFDFIMAIVKSY